uniref:Uncharacterized protein n=1 Tax=Lepeophtheirus salmonis TaxID=72036 RepID=A0A0K2UCI8_LEPSM
MKAIRVAHGRKLLNNLKSHSNRISFHLDEKQWTVHRSTTFRTTNG